jgi:hypothetical protein
MKLLRAAYYCWAVPLGLAVISLAGYWFNKQPFFLNLGVINILIGSILTIIGLISIVRFIFRNVRAPDSEKQSNIKAILPSFLLLSNIPVAMVFVLAVGYLWEYSESFNVRFPRPLPQTANIFPKKYDWCYLGISYKDYSEKSDFTEFTPYSGIVDYEDDDYRIQFVFNNDWLKNGSQGNPAGSDRLTMVEMMGKFQLPDQLAGLDYMVMKPTADNRLYKKPYLLHIEKDYIVTIRVLQEYSDRPYRRLRIHYPVDDPYSIERGPHEIIKDKDTSIIKEILHLRN